MRDFMHDELSQSMTSEERVAVQIGDLLSNLRLDLESVAFYMTRSNPIEIYKRFESIAVAARKFTL